MATDYTELLAQSLSGGFDPRQAKLKMLQQQIEHARALQGAPVQRQGSWLGTALGGLGEVIQTNNANQQAAGAQGQIDSLLGQQASEGAAYRALISKNAQAQQEQEAAERARLEQERQRMADPNSERSQLLVQLAKRRGYDVQQGITSAATLEPVMGIGQDDYKLDADLKKEREKLSWEREKFTLEQKVAQGKATEAEKIRLQNMDEGLRKELASSPAYKGFLESSAAFNKLSELRAATKTDPKNTSNDVAFVYSLMKMIDAGAAVQEGDKANAEATANLKGQLMNALDKAIHGTGLQPEQRESFYRTGVLMFQGQKKIKDQVEGYFAGLSKKQGGDPTSVSPFVGGEGGDPAAPATPEQQQRINELLQKRPK